jgi:hypothetical protein
VQYYDIYGLPKDHLWGDVVMMNQLRKREMPSQLIKFTEDVGDFTYYLDSSRMDSDWECPVVVFGWGENGEIVADSFLDFLRKACEGLV